MENNNKLLTHSTKMDADESTEFNPNAPKFIGPNCLPKPESLGFC